MKRMKRAGNSVVADFAAPNKRFCLLRRPRSASVSDEWKSKSVE